MFMTTSGHLSQILAHVGIPVQHPSVHLTTGRVGSIATCRMSSFMLIHIHAYKHHKPPTPHIPLSWRYFFNCGTCQQNKVMSSSMSFSLEDRSNTVEHFLGGVTKCIIHTMFWTNSKHGYYPSFYSEFKY